MRTRCDELGLAAVGTIACHSRSGTEPYQQQLPDAHMSLKRMRTSCRRSPILLFAELSKQAILVLPPQPACSQILLLNPPEVLSPAASKSYLAAGMDCPRVQYEDLNKAVEIEMQQQGLQVLHDPGQQVDKIVQLYEVRP